jgi:hypothetical protein
MEDTEQKGGSVVISGVVLKEPAVFREREELRMMCVPY